MSDAPVGRSWPAHSYEVGLEKVREYARAIGEEARHHHDRSAARSAGFSDVPAPPTFAAVFCAPAVGAAIFDPEVGLFDPAVGIGSYRFVHRTQRFEWLRPVLVGDVITTEVTLAEAGSDEAGRTRRVFESVSRDASGETVLRARYGGVVPHPPGGGGGRRRVGDPPIDSGEIASATRPGGLRAGERLPVLRYTPDRYAPVRYAGASGDFTPFHLDERVAHEIGLPGVILHGLHSFAVLARAHTAPFGADPRVLVSLEGVFRRPALPEAELEALVRVEAAGDGGARTRAELRQGETSVIGAAAGRLRDHPYPHRSRDE